MKPIRTLVVDDNAVFLEAFARYLGDIPQVHVLGTSRSGSDALNQVRCLKPDLVLMDLIMPEMDGLETTRRVKQFSGPPLVIVVSLHDGPELVAAVRNAGADGFLMKQTFSKGLLPLLQSLVSRLD